MVNPQYHLRFVSDKTTTNAVTSSREKRPRLKLKVHGDRRIPFNVTVVWSHGQRVTDLVQNEIVATSGPYNHGFASVQKDLPGIWPLHYLNPMSDVDVATAGDYTVIVSAFEPRHTGPFSFSVDSTHRFELTPIPQESAGMFTNIESGSWYVCFPIAVYALSEQGTSSLQDW